MTAATTATGPGSPAAATPRAQRTPLSCLGCGCAGGVGVILAVIVSLTWIGYRSSERYREEMGDPAAREARVQALLPHEALPPGYHALGGISIPFMMEMAILADRPPGPAAGGPVEAGFLLVRTRGGFGRRERLAELFSQEHPDPKAFSQGEVGFEPREEVGRGEIEAGGAVVHYYARRGELAVDQSRFGVEVPEGAAGGGAGGDRGDPAGGESSEPVLHRYPGLATMMLVDCPADDRVRVALWFTRDPHPDQPVGASGEAGSDRAGLADLTGTPGDPAALTAFLDRFRLCG